MKANLERGGHRPKKGLLRGGKNRKEEGYIPSGGKRDRRERRDGMSGGKEEASRRDTQRFRGICNIVGRYILQRSPS